MNPLISFVINMILIDIIWKAVEMIVDGHTTTSTVDFIISVIWSFTMMFKRN
jgi:hypothetical protein